MSDFLAESLWEAGEPNRGLWAPSSISLQIAFYLQLPAWERWWLLNEKQMELSLVKVDSHNNKELSSDHPEVVGLKM